MMQMGCGGILIENDCYHDLRRGVCTLRSFGCRDRNDVPADSFPFFHYIL